MAQQSGDSKPDSASITRSGPMPPRHFLDIDSMMLWVQEQRRLDPNYAPKLKIGDKVFDPLPLK
jgi:hypothetical protein